MTRKIAALLIAVATLFTVMAPAAEAEQFPPVIENEDDVKAFTSAPPKEACDHILNEGIKLTGYIEQAKAKGHAAEFYREQLWRYGQVYDMINCGDLKHDIAKAQNS